MFEHLVVGETILYYREKQDNSRVEKTLRIDKLYKNEQNIWTIEGDFGEVE
jgi:hypothetical protein